MLAPAALAQGSADLLAPPDRAPEAASIASAAVVATPRVAPAPEDLTPDDRRRLTEAEAALEAGKPSEALEKAQLGLEYTPKSVLINGVAARAAAALGKGDLALHYALTALSQPEASEDSSLKGVVADLEALQVEIDPNHASIQAELDAYAATLFDLGKSAARRKLWANAVDFLQRCEGTAMAGKAEKELAKIYKKSDAVEALIASGLDIEFEDASIKKSPESIAKIDKKHEHWENRLEVDSKGGYTIESNGGYLFTHMVARAMDQVNLFLRDMYQHKVQGQRMRGAKIKVYKSRQNFEDNEDVSPGVGGWFSPSDNEIVTYSDESTNKTLAILFHEASHQFMRDVTKNTIPGWISEGVACYFEGTELMPNGKILANLIPSEIKRLTSLVSLLRSNSVDLEDVVTFFQGGSPPGAHYPYGWGLVYFMRNYEDEAGHRVYRKHFDDFVATYKGGGQHNVKDRFIEYFIERPAVEGVETFEDFERHWADWINDLNALNEGGKEVADELIARGDRQLAAGLPENAVESYRWALDKRSGDERALYGLAIANQAMKNDDVALYYFRGVLDWSLSQTDQESYLSGLDMTVGELTAVAMEGIKEVNADVAEGMLAANDVLANSLLGLAKEYRDNEFPRRGMSLIERTTALIGPRADLLDLHAEILTSSGIDLREKRRLRVDKKLSFWSSTSDEDFEADGDDIRGKSSSGVSNLTYSELPPEEYHFEATIEVESLASSADGHAVVGVYFGSGLGVRQLIGYAPDSGGIVHIEKSTGGLRHVDTLERVKIGEGESFDIAIVVADGEVQLLLDGLPVDGLDVDEKDVPGQVGIFVQDATAKFTNMRFVY